MADQYEEHIIKEPNNVSELTFISDPLHHGELLIEVHEWNIDPDDDIPNESYASLFLTPWKVREMRDYLTYWLERQEQNNDD